MLDPIRPGFTGTVWEAIPPEQLVHDLTTGPGSTPMTETIAAYGALATGLTEAATEFRAMLTVLGDVWSSSSSADGLAQLALLAEWLDRSAEAARTNAARVARQAAAYQTAGTAVPHLAEMAAAARQAQDLVRVTLIGTPLAGLLDTAEQQLDLLRQQASRAMRSYESASEPLAHPWRLEQAPQVSAAANLLTEQSPGSPRPGHDGQQVVAETLEPQPSVDVLSQLNIPVPQQVQIIPTIPVDSAVLALPTVPPTPVTTPTAAVPTAAPVVQSSAVATPPAVAPPPVLPAPPEPHPPAPRAGDADPDEITGTIAVHSGFATAPAVLGAAAPVVARATPAQTVPGQS
ncbi:PPE domain-containing protein [Nocardia macrotermitis]|uniref:PPE domain-containing protein n=1 Tax=Nocardia macrotermitis TaxID=2585198 RepID=A0A7K0DAZ8_9NOCA|nr:PPE domain-containing protein [Nocardia macrotermitis]MQY22482.1 hypothetical protein [Nocardia macrotermitis]